jgi:hypothetical protein
MCRDLSWMLCLAFLLAGATQASRPPEPSEPAGGDSAATSSAEAALILWESPEAGGEELAPVWRHALAEALREVARGARVVVCFDEAATSTDPAVVEACGDRALSAGWLRWTGEVSVGEREAVAAVHLILRLEARQARPKRKGLAAETFLLQENVFVPDGTEGPELEGFLARRLAGFVRMTPAIEGWFRKLRAHPRLRLVDLPLPPFEPAGPAAEPPPQEVGAAAAVAAEEAEAWNQAEGRIVDLLLEGRFAEAQEAAERLLLEGLPQERSSRVEALREKAAARLRAEHSAPAPAELPGEGPASAQARTEPPVEAPRAEEPRQDSADESGLSVPASFAAAFAVRVAEQGKGFAAGTDGRLTIDGAGLRFAPDGGGGGGWSVMWSVLAAAQRAEGLWDVRAPLEIRAKDGSRHFLVELDGSRGFGSGERILAAIAQGRRRR